MVYISTTRCKVYLNNPTRQTSHLVLAIIFLALDSPSLLDCWSDCAAGAGSDNPLFRCLQMTSDTLLLLFYLVKTYLYLNGLGRISCVNPKHINTYLKYLLEESLLPIFLFNVAYCINFQFRLFILP